MTSQSMVWVSWYSFTGLPHTVLTALMPIIIKLYSNVCVVVPIAKNVAVRLEVTLQSPIQNEL